MDTRNEVGVVLFEDVGDVFKENEAEDDVVDGRVRTHPSGRLRGSVSLRSAVFRRVHVVAEIVGGQPELRLEADGGGGVLGAVGFGAGHGSAV